MIYVIVATLKQLFIFSLNVPSTQCSEIETMFLPNLSLNIILNGDVDSSAQRNIGIHSAVSKYIIKTNRF